MSSIYHFILGKIMEINLAATNHKFEKQNLVTLQTRAGLFDLYKCQACGLTGKLFSLGILRVSNSSRNKANNCPKAPSLQKIIITNCYATGKMFANLKPGSVHVVVNPPEGQDNSRGVWVMGVGEPVKVLFSEYEVLNYG